jgi:hypothetical protein
MTSKIKVIKEFNEILEYLLIQVTPIIGDKYHFRFKQIVKANVTLPIEQFLVHILPKRDKVLNKDESLFNSSLIAETFDDNDLLSKILTLENNYKELQQSSKDNIWDFFQALLILGEDYIRLTH